MQEDTFKRKLIECAFTAGKKRQSPQTGFVHYFYENEPYEEHHTIAIYENFCFALALLRTRLSDHVIEAKLLIDKLLAFEVGGNFPIYIHDYPQCKKRWQGINLLPVISDVLLEYNAVLGEKLSSALSSLQNRLIDEGKRLHLERPLPKAAEAKLMAALERFNEVIWVPTTASEWGEYLIAAKLASSEHLEKAIHKAKEKWHPKLCAYIGAQKGQQQERGEMAVTLFDLWMGQLFRNFSKRALQDHPIHLQAALIPHLNPLPIPENFSSHLTLIEEDQFLNFWGSEEVCHSLCCNAPKGGQVKATKTIDGIEAIFTLSDTLPVEEEDRMEVCFYADVHDEIEIFVNDKKATTFKLNDKVVLKSKGHIITLVFSQEGEGMFFGHLLRANRPNQTSAKRERRFEAYDWQIALRTLRRGPRASIKLLCKVEEGALTPDCP